MQSPLTKNNLLWVQRSAHVSFTNLLVHIMDKIFREVEICCDCQWISENHWRIIRLWFYWFLAFLLVLLYFIRMFILRLRQLVYWDGPMDYLIGVHLPVREIYLDLKPTTPRSTQPGHPSWVRCHEYCSKGGNGLRLESEGRYVSCLVASKSLWTL